MELDIINIGDLKQEYAVEKPQVDTGAELKGITKKIVEKLKVSRYGEAFY